MTAPSEPRLRIALVDGTGALHGRAGETLQTIAVRVTEAESGRPIEGCYVDFICRPSGIFRLDGQSGVTNASGEATVSLLATRSGDATITCVACTTIDSETMEAAPLVITGVIAESSPASHDGNDTYGTPLERASVVSVAHEPYVPPQRTAWRFGTAAALAVLTAVAFHTMRLDETRHDGKVAHYVCKVMHEDGDTVTQRCVIAPE